MRPWLLVALLAAAAADIVGVEPESFDRRAQLRGDDEELEPRGPYGSGTWLAGASDFKDVPPQLVLPG